MEQLLQEMNFRRFPNILFDGNDNQKLVEDYVLEKKLVFEHAVGQSMSSFVSLELLMEKKINNTSKPQSLTSTEEMVWITDNEEDTDYE
jgi:hypothetical protein